MERINFKTENFEGPMDLLLHLAARHKLEISEVRISLIIDQYLAIIGSLDSAEPDSASEFVEMAARLVYMKSAALLPRPEEAEELRRELVGQLIEYGLCKAAAEKLGHMRESVFFAVRETLKIKFSEEYKVKHDKYDLSSAFAAVMSRVERGRLTGIEKFEEIVVAPVVSVSAKVIYILRSIRKGLLANARELFEGSAGRGESVAMFLGLLELINAKRVFVGKRGEIKTGTAGFERKRAGRT